MRTFLASATAALMASATAAFGSGESMPWDEPLSILSSNVTGPLTLALGLIAIASAGAIALFGGDMSNFMKRFALIAMIIAIMGGGASFIAYLIPGADGASYEVSEAGL